MKNTVMAPLMEEAKEEAKEGKGRSTKTERNPVCLGTYVMWEGGRVRAENQVSSS